MNNKTKRYLIAGAIGLVTITGAFAYLQYTKLRDFTLKVKNIAIKTISAKVLAFDLFLYFENKSGADFTIVTQNYDVYVNDVFIAKIVNTSPNKVKAKSTSEIGVNVSLSPADIAKKIGSGAIDLLMSPENIKIRVECEMKAKLWVINGNIKTTYSDTLKNMLAPKQPTA